MQNEILEEPSPPGAEDVTAGLRAHLVERTGALPWIPLTLLLRDNDNRVRGGIRGAIALCWLQVDHFWVDEALRGQGYGSRLLDMAEEAARIHGAIGAQLTTSTFQAEGFYRKQGYAEIGRLKDRPPGHDRIWMAKRWGRGPQKKHSCVMVGWNLSCQYNQEQLWVQFMSTRYRVAMALVLGLLPLAWSILLIPVSRNMPKWMLPLNWYGFYMLPVLLLGAAAIAYLRPRFLTIPMALFYIPLMYLWTLGFTLGICAEFFGGCK